MARVINISHQLLMNLRAWGMELPENIEVRQTRAGPIERDEGAWSWYIVDLDKNKIVCGSRRPMREFAYRARTYKPDPNNNPFGLSIVPFPPHPSPRRVNDRPQVPKFARKNPPEFYEERFGTIRE